MNPDEYNEMVHAFLEIMHETVYAVTVKDRTAIIDGSIVDCEDLSLDEIKDTMAFIKDGAPRLKHSESIKEFMSRDMDISKEMELLDKALNGDRSREIWKEMGDDE